MAREAALFLFKVIQVPPAGLMHLLGREADVSDYRLNIPIGNIYGLLLYRDLAALLRRTRRPADIARGLR